MSKYIDGVGEVDVPRTFKERLVNFWYHYKWHTVVALFLVVAILVCSLQFCAKKSYDVYVLYAGSKSIGRTTENGNPAEIATIGSSLKRVARDFDGDGEVVINFTNYIYYSSEELAELGADVDPSYVSGDKSSLEGALNYSEYYLCFISPAVYEAYNYVGGLDMFVSLEEYKSVEGLDFYNGNAIKLSSTDFYSLPGISGLPEDTLICIKSPSVLAAKSKEHKKHISNAFDMLENIISYKNS